MDSTGYSGVWASHGGMVGWWAARGGSEAERPKDGCIHGGDGQAALDIASNFQKNNSAKKKKRGKEKRRGKGINPPPEGFTV